MSEVNTAMHDLETGKAPARYVLTRELPAEVA